MKILTLIENETRIPASELALIVRSANHRYKSYTIPKKTGGVRLIQHPARELKFLQRWIVEKIFSRVPIHAAETAYQRGSKISTNAEMHKNSRYFLKMDFEDFFPSILLLDVASIVRRIVPALPFELDEARYPYNWCNRCALRETDDRRAEFSDHIKRRDV